jgi:serine/threonine protein kinase
MYENILQLYTSSKQGTNEVQTACILLQGALALHHLHSQRFIHRDVKP